MPLLPSIILSVGLLALIGTMIAVCVSMARDARDDAAAARRSIAIRDARYSARRAPRAVTPANDGAMIAAPQLAPHPSWNDDAFAAPTAKDYPLGTLYALPLTTRALATSRPFYR